MTTRLVCQFSSIASATQLPLNPPTTRTGMFTEGMGGGGLTIKHLRHNSLKPVPPCLHPVGDGTSKG